MNKLPLFLLTSAVVLSFGVSAGAQFAPFNGGRLQRDAFPPRDPFGSDLLKDSDKVFKPIEIKGLPQVGECPVKKDTSEDKPSKDTEDVLADQTSKISDDVVNETAVSKVC